MVRGGTALKQRYTVIAAAADLARPPADGEDAIKASERSWWRVLGGRCCVRGGV